MKVGLDHAGSLFLRAVVKRMKTMGLSQSELARRMHASRPYVVKVLRGDVNITLGSAARFAKALQMDFLPVLVDRSKRPEGTVSLSERHGRRVDEARTFEAQPELGESLKWAN